MSRRDSLPAVSGASPEGGNAPLWVVAHRGASGHAPENTMAAFRRAVELGAMFIETDLQLSRDARFVATHGETRERTTRGVVPNDASTSEKFVPCTSAPPPCSKASE